MYKGLFILGIIPARGGSKGIKNKNTRNLCGKPLIAYSIEMAKKSKYLDRTIITTDSAEIADVAKKYGGDVPFMRPADLAKDDTPMIPVLIHAMKTVEDLLKRKIDIILLLDPTAPLRIPEDIDTCISRCIDEKRDSVITVTPSERSPYMNMIELDNTGKMHLVKQPDKPIHRRQDAPKVFNVTSGAYALTREFLLTCTTVIGKNTAAVIVPEERAGHIDSEMDFKLVEFLMEATQ
jgi:CMP-N-acetylneuraminic acid synthetase